MLEAVRSAAPPPRAKSGASVRVLAPDDVPAVADLFARVYPEHRWSSPADCEAYFREMLFGHPWRDLGVPSWVAEDNGRMSGCYAVMPRPMRFRGRLIRVAVGFQFMIDPDFRSGVTAFQLVKACLTGPQDLTIADGASDQTRRGWDAFGGSVPLLYGLHWTRPLRPAAFALGALRARGMVPQALASAARPLAALADAWVSRMRANRFMHADDGLAEAALDAGAMLALFPEVVRRNALQPAYDARGLAWLLEQAARKKRFGALRARLVLEARRKPIGWYVYYARRGAVGEVVQIAATYRSFPLVLRRLLADAWREGATALHGRLEPQYYQELSERHAWLRTDGTWTMAYSRDAELMAAFHRGDAFFSRLDGEWWLRFLG
jgi:hypothetical protein